jgi:hypothetical protein
MVELNLLQVIEDCRYKWESTPAVALRSAHTNPTVHNHTQRPTRTAASQ